MLHKLLIYMALCSCIYAEVGFADEVVTWIDDNGVTHFGNAQFAPAGRGQSVEVAEANAMDKPDLSILSRDRRSAQVTVLERTKMKNPRGFRGHHARESKGRGRRAR